MGVVPGPAGVRTLSVVGEGVGGIDGLAVRVTRNSAELTAPSAKWWRAEALPSDAFASPINVSIKHLVADLNAGVMACDVCTIYPAEAGDFEAISAAVARFSSDKSGERCE